jgi:hypothetical protein
MPYCLVAENPAETAEHFERVNEHLRTTGPLPPEGQRLLISGPGESGGWRNISVWDSIEAQQRFFQERLKPAVAFAGCPMESASMTMFEVHSLLAGDLTGAPQPA